MIKTRLGKKIAGTLAGLITLGGMVGCDRNISWGSINGHSSNVGYTNSGMGAVAFRAAGTPLGDALGSLAQAEHTAWQNANAVEERIRKIHGEKVIQAPKQYGYIYDIKLIHALYKDFDGKIHEGIQIIPRFLVENSRGQDDIMYIVDFPDFRDNDGKYRNADGEVSLGKMLTIESDSQMFAEPLFIPTEEIHKGSPLKNSYNVMIRIHDLGLGRAIGAREMKSVPVVR